MARRLAYLFLAASLSIVLIGCGYTSGSLLPANLKAIYVDNFKNQIDIGNEITETSKYALYRPGLENEITNSVVNRFTFDGKLKIVRKDNADLILNGKLVDYRKEALRYDNADNVEEYRLKLTVDMTLVRVSDNKVLWSENGFTGESTYKTMGKFSVSEDVARDKAIEDLARRIVERTIEGW